MSQLILGIDVGTTNCKAGVFTREAECLAYQSLSTPLQNTDPNRLEYRPADLFHVVVRLIKGVLTEDISSSQITSLAITGMGEAGVPIDKKGKALYPAISWQDKRSIPQFEKILSQIKAERIKEITGLPPSYIYTINKLLWFKENRPKLFSKTDQWLDIPAWIAFRLTGQKAMDYSQASRTMAFDIWERKWWTEMLNTVDIDPHIFPLVTLGGTQLGKIRSYLADDIGLSEEVVVSVGGHDHICAALGAGALEPQHPLNSVGTTDVFLVSGGWEKISSLDNPHCSTGCHVVPEKCYTFTALTQAGDLVDWFVNNFYGNSSSKFQLFVKEASKIPRGSSGLRFIPPQEQEDGPGKFLGINISQGREHFARAILEGLAMEFRNLLETYPSELKEKVKEIKMVGGGARNLIWNRIKAETLGTNLALPQNREAAVLGAAILGGVGAGVYSSYEEAISIATSQGRLIAPDREGIDLYSELYRKEYEPLLKEV